MRAMVLDEPGRPLRAAKLRAPEARAEQVVIEVHACAVCRTDLHVVDGELPVRTEIEEHPLAEANEALDRVRSGQVSGAAVLVP